MQTVILAGGKGTRLRPITQDIPKSMVPILGKPFLQYQLEFLISVGADDFLFLVGYLGDAIKKYFKNGSKFGVKIDYSQEISLLGTAGALKNAGDKLNAEFLLLNGDTFLPIDYNELIRYFNQCNKVGVITVYDNPEKYFLNNIAVGKSNIVIDYKKNGSEYMTHIASGAMVFKKEILNLIPDGQVCSLEEDTLCKMIEKRMLLAFVSQQRFYDMGSFKGMELLKDKLASIKGSF